MGGVCAVLMLGESGPSPAEQLVHGARRTAVRTALAQLAACESIERIVVAAPPAELDALGSEMSRAIEGDPDSESAGFHFGERLTGIVARHNLERLVYFGGGSAPLLSSDEIQALLDEVATAAGRVAITNNLHSSDWIAITEAGRLGPLTERLPRDNMLGWVLQEEAGYSVRALAPSAATRLDIDTPSDLLALRWHPDCPPQLQAYLRDTLPGAALRRWGEAGRALRTPATQVALIGRVSASVWQFVDAHTRCWIRVFSEERGMTSSGRTAAGAVRSLLAQHIDAVGEAVFFRWLGDHVDATYFDTRIYLAHHKVWPSAADRFAADFGRAEQVQDERLRRFAEAAADCRTPVVMGGHGVVSGGLYALIESINAGMLP